MTRISMGRTRGLEATGRSMMQRHGGENEEATEGARMRAIKRRRMAMAWEREADAGGGRLEEEE
eukprot:2251293-Pyramimonas_sp.AAC.1